VPPYSPLIAREDSLLVIIDAQERLMPVIEGHQEVTDNLVRLAKFAGIVGLPVVVTEQQKLGATLPVVAEALGGVSTLSKITFDCFGSPEFVSALAAQGRGTLILAGIEAHICVAQTALTGVRDYRVQVVSDAVGSRTRANWLIALERVRAAGVEVTSTEMVIYELLRRAGTEEFRATLPLVK
jgi:nicotinamidase-related amidase